MTSLVLGEYCTTSIKDFATFPPHPKKRRNVERQMSYQYCVFLVCIALFTYLCSQMRIIKQEDTALFFFHRTRTLCRSKVTTHDALIQFWRPLHPLSRFLNLFSMLMQCGINLWSYLVNLPIVEEIFLLYCSFSLNKMLRINNFG